MLNVFIPMCTPCVFNMLALLSVFYCMCFILPTRTISEFAFREECQQHLDNSCPSCLIMFGAWSIIFQNNFSFGLLSYVSLQLCLSEMQVLQGTQQHRHIAKMQPKLWCVRREVLSFESCIANSRFPFHFGSSSLPFLPHHHSLMCVRRQVLICSEPWNLKSRFKFHLAQAPLSSNHNLTASWATLLAKDFSWLLVISPW